MPPAQAGGEERAGRSLVIVFATVIREANPYVQIKANDQGLMEVRGRFPVLRAIIAATRLQSLSICLLLASCARRLAIENASTPEFDIRASASRPIASLSP